MEKSSSIANIAKALTAFQSEMPVLHLDREVEVKTRNGGSYKFSYATIKNIVQEAKPLLVKNKLSYSQLVENDGSVTTLLMHESGEYLQSNLLIKGEETPQGIGSAITYAKRYSLSSILGIIADDDDDGNMAQGNEFKTNDKPWLNEGTQEYKDAQAKIKAGSTIDELKKIYKISNKTELKLFQPSAKPKCTDKALQQAIDRINKGEAGVYEKVKEAFELTARQDELLYDAVKKNKGANVAV